MELSAHYQKISELTERLSILSEHLELEEKQDRLEEVKLELENPDVWSNPEKAQSLGKERVQLDHLCETFSKSNGILSDAKELLEMAESENDIDTVDGLIADLDNTEQLISKYEFERMFSGEMDRNSAYLDIQSGSGGTEAQDWAEMILRMYLRWGDKHNFKVKLMEVSAGDVAGIKSATIHFDGEYAFGWLRSEIGIHRLVRKSPYNANGKRHTSFSSVFVSPEIDDDIEIVNEVMETQVLSNNKEINVVENENSSIIMKINEIIKIMSNKMNINISNKTENFITYYSSQVFTLNFGNDVKDDKDTIKLLLVVVSVFFIGIQMANTKTRKTYPGCILSFDGYPLYEDGDDSGIDYIACVLSKVSKDKLRSSVFKLLRTVKQESIKTRLKEIIQKFVITNLDIKLKLVQKREYIDSIRRKIESRPKIMFMPHIYPVDIKIVKTLPASFYEEMNSKLVSKRDNVYIYLNKLKSKNIEIGYIFTKIINDQLTKTNLLLTNFDEPYLENTCCLENYSKTHVLDYFNNKDSSLFKYADISKTNTDLYDEFINSVKPGILATKRTQISNSPLILKQFDEKTIYTTFISYCKWNKTSNMFSLNKDIHDICEIKDNGLLNANTIEDKIEILKKSGKQLNNSMLLVLMNKINKMNIVNIEPPTKISVSMDKYIGFLDNKKDDIVISKIYNEVKELTNTFDISMKKNERFKESYIFVSKIQKENSIMINNIRQFLSENAFLNGKEDRIINDFINNFENYETNNMLLFDKDV